MIPALLFCSNGKPRTEHWTNSMKKLSDIMNAKLVTFDCGHYIHQFKSEEMCAKIVSFVKSLNG